MPNPNEMEREAQERSEQYELLQRSRNNIQGLCKKDKEAALARIRALEQMLDLPPRNYNGG
jgi:hypothetical protein